MVTNFTNKTYSCLRAEALRRASVSFAVIRAICFYIVFPYPFLVESTIRKTGWCVKQQIHRCVSKVIMSPLTAELKCPLWKGKRFY
jgi:hypothetical protein